MKRIVAAGGAFAAAIGGILWFLLLMSTAADTVLFSRNYPLLIALNVVLALSMLGLVGWQLSTLWRDYQAQVFGARLKLRLMLMFGVIAVLPGALVYGVSVQFVTRSIESWFDVRVEKALESGLQLGRSALDSLLLDLGEKARSVATELTDIQESSRRSALLRLREEKGVQSVALFSVGGQLLSSATSELSSLLPELPSQGQLKQARSTQMVSTIEGDGGKLYLRVLVPVSAREMFEEPRILQLTQPVPAGLAQDADAVQGVYRDYQELQLAREGLTRIYALTLTLTVLVALFGAFALAYVMARRLAAPLYILAEGTQAVAQGDFSPRQAIYSGDELGVLTQSFNRMTRQLNDARRETERHRSELESARGYLESILANLSTGVLVFDRHFVLRTINEGALTILSDDFIGLVGSAAEDWPRQQALGTFIREQFSATDEAEWQAQLEMERPNGMPQVLLLRGSRLPEASGGGDVVVFDDVTRLIAAQRSAAWGEVARRLAHEIKNPLTPIQLSAERLQFKLADKLSNGDADMLARGTQTIINQVQAMKRMVDDFRDYARMPAPEVAALDLNELIGEVLGLYESSSAAIETRLADDLPPILGDATQLRQIIHNLLRNAEDALESRDATRILIQTEPAGRYARLTIADNGPGFPVELLPRIFEPYVTTKARGTGLGLPIVKKIVEEHLGTIEIGNAPEGGARIDIRLPLVKAEEAKNGNHSGR
ncbi:MAG: HAMP domain-containing protein [Gammaproteobacteria bacterium]|nr:HAMP domain-containing protein [Gammaproteobacteria bacterium]MBU1600425.1 HAMP domain-containing protein [Gammaproteobacteria bacterium]MBU2434881.1 HAMP domain-containing protein [Gammaproteobacteria bacterium]MBU2448117.1 HAMP domain-containing protein [Gammaproteobacteria bacterium]PKO42521.1 MAG: PAS domain-containing sensor histidine kinase [Betaproteobacteria bacterium HGW-Betaproteobacteria-4]